MNELNALVSKAAATKNSEDYEVFFRAMKNSELFFNLVSELPNGEGRISTPLVDVGPGLRAVLFFISKENKELRKPFGGISWARALGMVADMPKADGMVIHGDDLAWIAIDKNTAVAILSEL